MRIGSLFSGIGGLDLGLEWAGVGHTVWQVEREPFCRSVLEYHWPNTKRYDDVRTVGAHNLEYVDVICGGFPCQDISYAGKGLGLAGERSGLWYEFARIVGEMGPRFVVVENVAALITRGIGAVLGTLSDLGYDAQWRAIRASDVGAPHRRERIFIVAYSNTWGFKGESSCGLLDREPTFGSNVDGCGGAEGVGNPDRAQFDGSPGARNNRARRPRVRSASGREESRRHGQAQPSVGLAAYGIPGRVARWPTSPGQAQHEWEAPRTVEKADNRAAKLRALGNAVVPQVAKEIGRWLLDINAKQFVSAQEKP